MGRPGKVIVLEGVDASGKTTQYDMLCKRLAAEGVDFRPVTFPRYDEPSSGLVRMYLAGDFGKNPGDVNAYAASSFYAVDRYASFKKDWESYYRGGGVILCARYTTSNAVHQSSKVFPEMRNSFFEWLYNYEHNLLGIPAPDLVLFLDVPPEISLWLLEKRGAESGADIHERDKAYLRACHESAVLAAQYYGWARVDCVSGGGLRPAEDINDELYGRIKKAIG